MIFTWDGTPNCMEDLVTSGLAELIRRAGSTISRALRRVRR